jgi:hypothetical protein
MTAECWDGFDLVSVMGYRTNVIAHFLSSVSYHVLISISIALFGLYATAVYWPVSAANEELVHTVFKGAGLANFTGIFLGSLLLLI